MIFDNYIDEFSNAILIENDEILYIEVGNTDNLNLNKICTNDNLHDITQESLNIYRFDDFDIKKNIEGDQGNLSYTLSLLGITITIFKDKTISNIDEIGERVLDYKKEVDYLADTANNLLEIHKKKNKKINKSRKNSLNPNNNPKPNR